MILREVWLLEPNVPVVFAIRTRRQFFRSKPDGFLVAMAVGIVAVAIALPLLPSGRLFGFVPPPPLFFAYLIGWTIAYLALVEMTKSILYRVTAGRSAQPATGLAPG